MLVITFLVGSGLVIFLITIAPEQIHASDTRSIILGLLLLPILYGLNRMGRTHLAAHLYVLLAYMVFALPAYGFASGAPSLAFVAISFLLGAIFFSSRAFLTLTSGGTVLIGVLILLNISNPDSHVSADTINYLSIWFFLVLMAFLTNTFVSYLRTTEAIRRRELESANEQLRASEVSLERRVEERTHDLDIARKKAEEAKTVISQFLAATSHELRTPLNAIINFGAFLQEGMFGDVNDEQEEAAGHIVSSGNHLLALINDVLDISKIEAGALQLYIEDNLNLNSELHELFKTANNLIQRTGVEANLEIPDLLPAVRGDRLRIRQILLNLISNACKFTEHGSVTVRAYHENLDVVIAVADTGPGIRPADCEAIFETFRQTEAGVRKGKGTGLGLPIALSLAEAHFGSLTVESTYGQGSVFTVRLPIKSDKLIPSKR
jgi:signal transduction histidine kinase